MSNYDISILVNGSRCKQYSHNGKIFVEAKKDSEYTIEIKNNTWARILAVASVDGLDVLDGKPAREDNPGYVVNGYNTLKIDGFRVSNEKVAKFLFDYKGGSYAADKGDGSERNVGVIGVRLFSEKVKPTPPPTIIREEHHHHHHHDYWWNRPYYSSSPTIWNDTMHCDSDDMDAGPTLYSCNDVPTKGSPIKSSTYSSTKGGSNELMGKFKKLSGTKSSAGGCSADAGATLGSPLRSMDMGQKLMFCAASAPESEPLGFDMGTKWGEAKESRVVEVDFEKGILALTTNIYYASRQSLIEMGIPLGNEKQVSFPEPFVDSKYAKPPKGWTEK